MWKGSRYSLDGDQEIAWCARRSKNVVISFAGARLYAKRQAQRLWPVCDTVALRNFQRYHDPKTFAEVFLALTLIKERCLSG
jgi:hypothetical protein